MKLITSTFAILVSLSVSPAFAGATINVKLWDKGDINPDAKLGMGMHADLGHAMMGIDIDKTAVTAGPVTFQVRNSSKETVHEMIVVPVEGADATLPYVDKESRIDEDSAGHLGEVSELDPGKSGSLTLDLKPGSYAVLCNVPGHFMNGMWKTFLVEAAPVTN